MIKNGIEIIKCKGKEEASKKTLEFLAKNVDQDTLLLLSGGASPQLLYQLITENKALKPGAVALIDERFGLPLHDNSNEKMISETGLIAYLNNEGISFYGILTGDDMVVAAEKYEQVIGDLFKKFSKKIAVMGIGKDGHTAGVKPDFEYNHKRLVVSYDDKDGYFGKRITLTFEALMEIDEFIILAFGQDKQIVLHEIFRQIDQKLLPAVFFTKTIAKTVLLTDIDLVL